ncbi:MAG: flagellar hook-length control protein FliK [Lachnospiraceae bacterium]|nr:flagellar hook-length control protein FliK [Lachnospiraceae bacterium]
MPGSKSFLFDGGNAGVQRLNLASIFKRNDQNIKANDTAKAVESMSKGEKSYRLQNDIRNLLPGQTIQGAVVSRNGNTVQIALSQDLLINARIEQSISLALGQNMSFEVKTNNGAVLSLAPLYANMANQATILRALGAAGLPETAENIEMVARMMEEGMPIDKDTILNVSRQLLEFPTQDPASVIQMIRLGLSVTEANIEQFEQYQNAGHQLLGSAETIAQELPEIFHELMGEGRVSQAYAFYESVLDIFTEAGMAEAVIQKGAENEAGQTDAAKLLHAQMQDAGLDDLQLTEAKEGAEAQDLRPSGQDPALTDSQWRSLGDMLRELGVEEHTAGQIRNGELPAGEVLSLIRNLMPGAGEMPSHVLERLFGGKEFEGLLRAEVERQWLIEPREVADPRKVEQLYERIREQSMRLNEAVQTAGKADAPVARSAQNLQNNVDFMNQMNHMFAYIQLPLKMAGNHAHGDLYVYTNKKNLAAKDGNVSALLHLDMEHLGAMDVYVTMQHNKVNTNFTLQDESSLDLIEQHISLLDERLAGRGYTLKAQFQVKEEDEEKNESIMQTILSQDKNISVLSRTSFDMRA